MNEQDIYIQEVSSTVSTFDSDLLLTPQRMRQIVAAVSAEMDRKQANRQQRGAEQQISRSAIRRHAPGV
jgi:hypothetical protein